MYTENMGLMDTPWMDGMHEVTEHDRFVSKPTIAGIPLIPMGLTGVYRFGIEHTIAGGDPTSPVQYPLFQTDPTGTFITMDEALQEPERITRDIADLTMQRFFIDQVFSQGGGVRGGGLFFERPNALATDLYGEREPKEVAPGAEFPFQTFVRGVPMIARPRKIGSKWWVSKEARKRNDTNLLARYMRQTANSIRRRLENLGLAELAAVVTSESRFANGTSWGTYAGLAPINRTGTTGPVSDIMATITAVDLEERGHNLDSIIIHPNQALSIQQAYPNQSLISVLGVAGSNETGGGIRNVYVTPRQTAGKALLFEKGQVGVWKNEFPLEEDSWEQKSRQITWYQWSISPLFAVVDQFAVRELRSIA